MVIKGRKNQSVAINILGYQFPDIKNEKSYDANWLQIKIRVDGLCGAWQKTDPALLTWEVDELIEWMHDLSNDNCTMDCLCFTEPNMVFQYLGMEEKQYKIRIHFELEFRNPQLPKDEDCYIDCLYSKEKLLGLCFDLEEELQYYPKR
ncbi:WapI family immunity protein [Marinifilum caeruleilacunae]|uniref:Uncharacterized protein n=1 Tax=Marinifilum caeruleilacunae TaxID=2499076 RepID=A0ABX1WWT0_9BACT|nr:hypothetical protein [Marinifilum caeruleilacunae]NOU60588.1 hypothetical protein [Marinifilum caeruleilacunae]